MKKPYIYLATVYTSHPQGLNAAFLEACKVTAKFMKLGIPVVSPIAHSHPVAVHGGLDQVDHDFWMDADRPLMDNASALMVVRMQNWGESKGIRREIEVFKEAGKPIFFVDP
jgi:hypothetical protein